MTRLATGVAVLFLVLASAPALARDDLSALIASQGLVATEAALLSEEDGPNTRFALGFVRFLGGVEAALQARWRFAPAVSVPFLPVFRLQVPPNPTPQRLRFGDVETLFADLASDMAAARAPLTEIADTDAVGVSIRIADLWLDIDANGQRGPGEDLVGLVGSLLAPGATLDAPDLTIRFDTADAAWLAAYTHLLEGVSELVRAFAPSGPLTRMLDASNWLDMLAADTPYVTVGTAETRALADPIATLLLSLRQQPDPARIQAVRQHFLAMVRQNRVVWSRVATETDNEAEWIPNATQVQALGLPVPPDTGPHWLAVLGDAEALLEGRLLIPHWRLRSGAGINLRRLMEAPIPIDLIGWAHGVDLLPYAEEGPRISDQSWRDFVRITGGNAALFAVFLN